jgi:NAD(P)H-hydrate epimerase
MGAVDRYVIDHLRVPGVALMENAGAAVARRVAECIRELARSRGTGRAVVLCGPGNNGGDGFVVARRLASEGLSVAAYAFCPEDRISGDALTHLHWLKHCGAGVSFAESSSGRMSEDIERADVIVDAILGTGIEREVTGLFADVITQVNECGACVVAVDIPSGIDGATARVMGTAVRADITVTFAYPKLGQLFYPGREFCGQLEVADIGIPSSALDETEAVQSVIYLVNDERVRKSLPRRVQPSHKGTYGRLVVIGGSAGMPGAASLACSAALRAGAGTVVAITPRSVQPILHGYDVEVMSIGAGETSEGGFSAAALESVSAGLRTAAAFVLGPGIGRSTDIAALVKGLLTAADRVGVVDADALVVLAREGVDLASVNTDLVLTPHPGEMSALTGVPIADILDSPVAVCARHAVEWRKTVVLKGATTVIGLPDGSVHISTRGNAGLATGGTGDVLAGIIGAFLAQGIRPSEAAICGTYVHGVAGELASQSGGLVGMLARDVVSSVPSALENIANPGIGETASC